MTQIYRVVNILHSTSGLAEDDCQNTFHFQTTDVGFDETTAEGLAQHIEAAFNAAHAPGSVALTTRISGEISRTALPTVKVYDVAGGSPGWTSDWSAMEAPSLAEALPTEVAACLSYNADLVGVPEEAVDDADPDAAPERPRARRRGRIYIGPWTKAAAEGAPANFNEFHRDILRGMGNFLANPAAAVLTTVGTKWGVYSTAAAAPAFYEIVRVSADNAFDTQRRRGRKATVRDVLAV